jgi:hypothetical protein
VVDHVIDDAMHQRDRPFRQREIAALAEARDLGDAAPPPVVHRHQIIGAEEEVDVERFERMLLLLEIDAVQDHI